MRIVALRRAAVCAAALGFFALLAVNCSAQNAQGGPVSARAATVVVFPFENSDRAAQWDWLGEGLAELTADQMTGRGPTVFSRDERLAALEKMGLPVYAKLSRATMLKLAAEMDADYIVFGEYSAQPTLVRSTTHVLSVNPPRMGAPITESGSLDALAQMQARAVWSGLCQMRNNLSPDANCEGDPAEVREFANAVHGARADAFEFYIKGLTSADDDVKLRDLREAARLDPDWDEAAYALGHAYFQKRDCEAAQPWLEKITQNGPHSSEAQFEGGVCSLLRNDFLHAESSFSALAARPDASEDPEVANDLGVSRLRQARYKDALADFTRAQTLDPGEPDYDFNVALAEYLLGQAGEAVRSVREAVKLAPDDSEAKALLVAALDRSGASTEANALRGDAGVVIAGAPYKRDIEKLDPTAVAKLAKVKAER